MSEPIQLLPPTSLSNAVKQGGPVLESWLNHQTILALPRLYNPPPDTRVPWNKSHTGMDEVSGPSFARIYQIARPKKTVGTDVHTRSNAEVVSVPQTALNYNISPHVLMMSTPKKVYPPDVNEPWKLKCPQYQMSDRLKQISGPRKVHPSTDRPMSEIGHPPRAAIYGFPPSARARAEASEAPPPLPPPPSPPRRPSGVTSSTTGPTTSTSGPTTSTTGPSTSVTGATSSTTGGTSSTTGATSSTTGATSSTAGPTPSSTEPPTEATGSSSATGATTSASSSSEEANSSSEEAATGESPTDVTSD